jgi:Na+:H+ antiporter, NhaA family
MKLASKKFNLTSLFTDFFDSEKSGGIILIGCTVFSLILSNSPIGSNYVSIWNFNVFGTSVVGWINDGLMAIFFLMIGLELEREIYQGELSKWKDAILPVIAAIGGMLVPAAIYYLFNHGLPTQSGAGIPMATDIAFALGILSLLGSRVPLSFKLFLTALAVIDDLGAIIVIAIFYTKGIIWLNLAIVCLIWLLLFILNRLKIYSFIPYLIGGVVMWYFMHRSGVHASITGVILAFVIPFGSGREDSISYQLQKTLHKPVAYLILPLFALANTCIYYTSSIINNIMEPYSLGILLGLIVGKPLGIFTFSFILVKLKRGNLPSDMNWVGVLGLGCMGGIGFTMSIFISLLSFESIVFINQAKWIIITASLVSATIGYLILSYNLKKKIILN